MSKPAQQMYAEPPTLPERSVRRLLKPLIRFFFRRAVDWNAFLRLSREVYLEVAEESFGGGNASISQLHVATGIDRRVLTELRGKKGKLAASPDHQSIRSRVIALWLHSKRYTDKAGQPLGLRYETGNSKFHQLCEQVTQNVNPTTILAELERTGAVKRENGKIVVVRYNVSPLFESDEGIEQIAKDMALVLNAGAANLAQLDSIANLHIRTEFDNIYEDQLPHIRIWLLEQGKELHKKLRSMLGEHDRDMSPRADSGARAGARVALVTAAMTEPQDTDTNAA